MASDKTYKIVLTGLFAALCCVATFISVPTSFGYANLGDCFVIASGLLLGPIWGAAAGGIGSMLTDIFLGYAQYAPATLIIKALMAFVAAVLYSRMYKKVFANKKIVALIISAVAAEIIMVVGYLLYEAFILGYGFAALASLSGNLLQGLAGILACIPVTKLLEKSKLIR